MLNNWIAVLPTTYLKSLPSTDLEQQNNELYARQLGEYWTIVVVGDSKVFEVVETSNSTAAYWGRPSCSNSRLRSVLEKFGTDAPKELIPGQGVVISFESNTLNIRGSLSDSYRVFRMALGKNLIYCSDPLATSTWLNETLEVDEGRLHAGLAYDGLPYELERQVAYKRIDALRPGQFFTDTFGGSAESATWWLPPVPGSNANKVSNEISKSIDGSFHGLLGDTLLSKQICVDVSGGMDSTPLAFRGRAIASDCFTFSSWSGDSLHDDQVWIEKALKLLGNNDSRTLKVESADIPLPFDRVTECPQVWPNPFTGVANWSRIAYTARLLASNGVKVNVSGHGGDEVYEAPFEAAGLIKENGWKNTFYMLRRYRSLFGESRKNYLHWINWRDSSYRTSVADCLSEASPSRNSPMQAFSIGGGIPGLGKSYFPEWARVGEAAGNWVGSKVEESSGEIDVIDKLTQRNRVNLVSWLSICDAGYSAWMIDKLTSHYGVEFYCPILNDEIVDQALQVSLRERNNPYEYKSLAKRVFREHVPQEVLARASKADGTADVHMGALRDHKEIGKYICSGESFALGMISDVKLRDAWDNMSVREVPPNAIWRTISVEHFLRGRSKLPVSSQNK